MARNGVPASKLLTIAFTLAALIAVVVLKSRCGPAVDSLYRALTPPPASDGGVGSADAGAASESRTFVTPRLTPVDAGP